MPHLITRVRQVQVSIRTLSRQYHHADHTARAAIPPNSLLQRFLDKVHCLLLLHALSPVGVTVTVDIGGTGTADGIRLFVQRPAQGNAVDLSAVALVPARDNEASAA